MSNPWKEIPLSDYENHMKLDTVRQLQAMNTMMKDQLCRYPISTAMILGIAGGNGLNHVDPDRLRAVYGVDINPMYLEQCTNRYPELEGIFHPLETDLIGEISHLPKTELVVANLLIEYIGCKQFLRVLEQTSPVYVSCAIQVNTNEEFVSHSPYLHAFDRLCEVHYAINETGLIKAMEEAGYPLVLKEETGLPNGKKLIRLDFQHHRRSL